MSLSSAELAQMRTDLNLSLPGTAVIHTYAWTSDGQGGGTATFSATGTVSCRVSPLPSGEMVRGERVATETSRIITIPAFGTVTEKDRIVSNGVTYTVEEVRSRDWEISRRVVACEVD